MNFQYIAKIIFSEQKLTYHCERLLKFTNTKTRKENLWKTDNKFTI